MKAVKLRPFVPSGEQYLLAQSFFEELGFVKLFADDGLTLFRSGDQEFFLQNFHNREMQDNFMLEMSVESLDDMWTELQAIAESGKYPITAKEPREYPWGKREIHMIDPAGVCWHFSEASK